MPQRVSKRPYKIVLMQSYNSDFRLSEQSSELKINEKSKSQFSFCQKKEPKKDTLFRDIMLFTLN